MKKWMSVLSIAAVAAATAIMVGCDWSAGGSDDGFNTSQGAGVNVNFSGVYHGNFGGGLAVSQTTGAGNILTLTISQGGNRVDVTDNQGSTYQGTIGSPGAVADPVGGVYSTGAELVQGQINFSGKDEVAQMDVEFVGVIHVIAVKDIQGTKTESESEDSFDDTTETTYTVVDNGKTNIVTEIVSPTTTTKITVDGETGEEIDRTVEITTSDTVTVTGTVEYQITEANSQYRLEGTWVEQGGLSSAVDATSAGTSGIITTETTTETTPAT